MKNKLVPNRIKATLYSEGRIAIQATWGFGCEVNAGGRLPKFIIKMILNKYHLLHVISIVKSLIF